MTTIKLIAEVWGASSVVLAVLFSRVQNRVGRLDAERMLEQVAARTETAPGRRRIEATRPLRHAGS